MIFELLLAVFVVRYLRKSLQTSSLLPKWDRILVIIMYAAIALFVVYLSVPELKTPATWLSHLLLLYLVYILYNEKEFQSARQVMLAIAPFILVSLFGDITKLTDENKYTAWKAFVGTASVCSLFGWLPC